jgi:hypothetical protein
MPDFFLCITGEEQAVLHCRADPQPSHQSEPGQGAQVPGAAVPPGHQQQHQGPGRRDRLSSGQGETRYN